MATIHWNDGDIPSQKNKVVIITGANSGIGLESSRVMAAKGAKVIMAVRNLDKGEAAATLIKTNNPHADLDVMELDLADFASIKKFSANFHKKYNQLDILINNAGVMAPKKREITKQGFEVQFGANHLGHFLLTGLLVDILNKTPNSRIAVQSSLVHKQKTYGGADIFFDDLNWENSYNKDYAYGQSKLANLLFAYELDRRLKSVNSKVIVTAAHPGYTNTNLQKNYGFFVSVLMNNLFAMNVQQGSLQILRAATDPHLKGGEFIGPTKMGELKGYPEVVKSSEKSYDKKLSEKLWDISEKLTGFVYQFNNG
ncbi:oxidoreductase [Chryseobacterium sp.]|uniref:oxidoreductase n=1 Tax=Chryseobacterium sp. TaxID=1871047 RepID=UPI0035C71001